MNHGKAYRMGDVKATKRTQTKATARTIGRLRRLDATTKGRRRNPKRQTEVRTRGNVANGFLRTTFLPKLAEATLLDTDNLKQMEVDFLKSLSLLSERFGFELPPMYFDCPYNIGIAVAYAREKIKPKKHDWNDIRLVECEGSVFFAQRENFNTGMTLYYIPIVPLYRMLKTPKRKQSALLLLSACGYLYYIADVPYYRQEDCYLSSMYEFLMDWNEDEDEDIDPQFLSEHSQSVVIGDIMGCKLNNRENLHWFRKRLEAFRIRDEHDSACAKVAGGFLELYEAYPTMRLDHNVVSLMDEHDPSNAMTVRLDQYVSFNASNDGDLSKMLVEIINNDLQEHCAIDEPVRYIPIDGREIKNNDFGFEKKLFELMDELIYLLNNF